jgi:hypothetical protein
MRAAWMVRAEYLSRSSGFAASLVGGGLLAWAAALVVAAVWLPAQHRELVATRDAAATMAALAARRNESVRVEARMDVTPIERFRIGFSPLAERQKRLEGLLDAAARHGMQWQRTELRQTRDEAIGLARYEVTLPLTGTYPSLRALVDDVLLADAGLSLDRLQLRRPSAASAALDAETVWSLWMRSPDGGQSIGAASAPLR